MFEERTTHSPDIALDIIRNPNTFSTHFLGEYREVRKRLIDVVVAKDNIYAQSDESARAGVLQSLQDLFEDHGLGVQAGVTFHWEVYRPFAFDRGFTKKSEYIPGKWGDAAIPVSELSEEQKAEWERYLNSIEFTIKRRSLIAKAASLIPFPTVTTKYRSQNIPLAVVLEEAKRRIVCKLIPNISDEEAQMALGQRYTADIMRSNVSPEWFLN